MGNRILIVDDDEQVRALLVDIFKHAGYEIAGVATDGDQVVAKYQELQPDLVTMDIMMPHSDGVEAVDALLKVAPEAKIVMVTAITQMDTAKKCVKLGASGFIAKPFNVEDVIRTCERILSE